MRFSSFGSSGGPSSDGSTQDHHPTFTVSHSFRLDFGGPYVIVSRPSAVDFMGYFSQFRLETGHHRLHDSLNIHGGPS